MTLASLFDPGMARRRMRPASSASPEASDLRKQIRHLAAYRRFPPRHTGVFSDLPSNGRRKPA